MPSIINTNAHFSSELDLLSESAANTSTTTSSFHSNNKNSNDHIQEMKDRQRRQWLEPEDEFSVPIYTESPLITKRPLDMSSFLLNYRAMRRSVEIMAPPSSLSQSSKNHYASSTTTTTTLHPTLPDGPIYIHHRSTIAESPLSSVISSCAHLYCFDNSAIQSSKGPDGRMNHVLSNSATTSQSGSRALTRHEESTQNRYYNRDTSPSRSAKSRHDGDSTTMASGEHSFLESHIASISQWLTSNAV